MSDAPKGHAPETEQFDREINVRGIVISGIALVVVCVVAALLMWWLLKGFEHYDEKRDVRLSPVELSHPQQPPPAPLRAGDQASRAAAPGPLAGADVSCSREWPEFSDQTTSAATGREQRARVRP